MASTAKRARVVLTAKEKQEICIYSEVNPSLSHQSISEYFALKFNKEIKRRTIGDILSDRAKWKGVSNVDRKSAKGSSLSELDDALYLWFSNARQRNIPVTEDILRRKAQDLGTRLDVPEDFKYSSGWVTNFKKRHGISQRVISGESAGVLNEVVDDGIKKAVEVISQYQLKDVFNMDETALFFKMLPDRSLTTDAYTKGVKKFKDRLSIAFTTNATGTEKLKPVVIGKALKPRCFKNFNQELYVHYFANRKAWMTSLIFEKWILDLDRRMRMEKRNILLILDNASSHTVPDTLTNITCHFLPPNTTSKLQPMDAGIIRNFKHHYRKLQVRALTDAIDNNNPPVIRLDDAIRFIKRSWNEVGQKTIFNCWKHTGILSEIQLDEDTDLSEDESTREPRNLFDAMATLLNITPENICLHLNSLTWTVRCLLVK